MRRRGNVPSQRIHRIGAVSTLADGHHAPLGPAVEIARQVRTGAVSATEVVAATLGRIAELNELLNAFCEVRGADALSRAQQIDAQVAQGADPGALAGVPIAIKDVVWEAGIEATNGSRALLGFRPERSAVVVERLVAAGAVVVGRTNLPEFCYRGDCANELYGATANPWDLGRTSRGSSGGSAAAVAAGIVPVAIGSDGGGSIRIPASFCGVVGLKQSFGLVPREPGWPGWRTMNHVGAITDCVEDSALVLQVLAGPDYCDAMTPPSLRIDYLEAARESRSVRGLRVAASADLGYAHVDANVLELFRENVARFEALGAEITWAHPRLANPLTTWNTLAFADNVASEGHLLASGHVGADAAQLIHSGETISAGEYAAARNAQCVFTAEWQQFMLDFDLILTPAMECVAFPLGRTAPQSTGGVSVTGVGDDWCHFCYAFNLTGQPAISVPMGLIDGLPVGLQIVGRRWEDDLVLRAAAAWEAAYPWRRAVLTAVGDGVPQEAVAAVSAAVGRGTPSVELSDRGRLAAGSVVATVGGRVRVRRVFSPEDDHVVAELDDLVPIPFT